MTAAALLPHWQRTLNKALSLIEKGYHVFPVRVVVDPATGANTKTYVTGRKDSPVGAKWNATLDGDLVRGWWAPASRFADCMIGVATEPSGVVLIDLDTHVQSDGTRQDGIGEWARLHPQPYPLAAAVGTSSSGGRHLPFRADPKRPVRTTAGEIAPAVDSRGIGGMFICWSNWLPKVSELPPVPDVVPDSVPYVAPKDREQRTYPSAAMSPSGDAQERVCYHRDVIAAAKDGYGIPTASRQAFLAGQHVGAGQVEGQWAADVLLSALDCWAWKRPEDAAKVREQILKGLADGARQPRPWLSETPLATVSELPTAPSLIVAPASPPKATSSVSPVAATSPAPVAVAAVQQDVHWDDDADDEAVSSDDAEQDVPAPTWARTDLTAYVTGDYEAPVPTLMPREDGVCLFYPGLVHSMHGESESGKSWVAQTEAARCIRAGLDVLYADFESDAGSIVDRMLGLGCTPEQILAHLDYRSPESKPSSALEIEAWRDMMTRTYALAVIDGVTDSLGIWGAKSNDGDEVSGWMRAFPRQLAARTGAAVVLIDHVTKNADTRGRFATGSQMKMAGLSGAAYIVEVVEPLGRGLKGQLSIRVGKDRPGSVRGHGGPMRKTDRTQAIAVFEMDATGRALATRLLIPEDSEGQFRPTALMERVSRFLESIPGGAIGRAIVDSVPGRATYVRAAINLLAAEGWISGQQEGRGVRYVVAKPFREVGGSLLALDGNGQVITAEHVAATANDAGAASAEQPTPSASRQVVIPDSPLIPTDSPDAPAAAVPDSPPPIGGESMGTAAGPLPSTTTTPDASRLRAVESAAIPAATAPVADDASATPPPCPCGRPEAHHGRGVWATCRRGHRWHARGAHPLASCPQCPPLFPNADPADGSDDGDDTDGDDAA